MFGLFKSSKPPQGPFFSDDPVLEEALQAHTTAYFYSGQALASFSPDARSGIMNDLRSRISGIVFNDANADGVRDGSEGAMGGAHPRNVYLDLNNNGELDSGRSNPRSTTAGALSDAVDTGIGPQAGVSRSTLVAIRSIICTATQGYWPVALSAESITASAPS